VTAELIPDVIRDLNLPLQVPLVQDLLQIQTELTQFADLAAISQVLNAGSDSPVSLADSALVLALYCFLSSPDEFQLSWQRLYRLIQTVELQSQAGAAVAGAILGIVSGLYNGFIGLPTGWSSWRQITQPSDPVMVQLAFDRWEFTLVHSADQLLARWAGAGSGDWLQQPHASLITAPRVICPLSSKLGSRIAASR